MNIFNANFNKLLTLKEIKSTEIEIRGHSTLHVTVESSCGSRAMVSLSQYSKHPLGGLVADPRMVIAVCSENETAEALVFQNYLGTRCVNVEDVALSADRSTEPSMNQFLGHWLANLLK